MPLGQLRPLDPKVADLNGDGKPDLILGGDGFGDGPTRVTVLLGNGSGGFGAPAIYTVGASAIDVVVGDFDADGRPDLAATTSAHLGVSVLLNRCGSAAGSGADLALSVSAGQDGSQPGEPVGGVTYHAVVSNYGPEAAAGAAFTIRFPVSAGIRSATPSQGACDRGGEPAITVTCLLGTVAGGPAGDVLITIKVVPQPLGKLTTAAGVTHGGTELLDLVLGPEPVT